MKSQWIIVLAFSIVLLFSVNAVSYVWIVNNTPGTDADFTSIQAAHDGAADSDTIYVTGSPQQYGGLTIDKPLVWFGPGYFLEENQGYQANISPATVSSIDIINGAQQTVISGFRIISGININCDEIRVTRNLFHDRAIHRSRLDVHHSSHVEISSNCIENTNDGFGGIHTINIRDSDNIIVVGNYIQSISNHHSSLFIESESPTIIVSNNVIEGDVYIEYVDFFNNILFSGDYSGGHNHISNNITDQEQLGTDDGNQANIDMDMVFIGEGNPDIQWQLSPESPAIGAGLFGVDCGMYGGVLPYIPSGIPPIPSISEFIAPAVGNNDGLPVQIRVRSNQ